MYFYKISEKLEKMIFKNYSDQSIQKGLLKSNDVIEHGVETLNVSRPN